METNLFERANAALGAAGYAAHVREDKPLTHVAIVMATVAEVIGGDESGTIEPSLAALDALAALWTSMRSPKAGILPVLPGDPGPPPPPPPPIS